VRPVERTDANSRTAHTQLLAKARQGKIDVYFLGDSITRRWGGTDYPQFLAHWKETFFGWNAANFGWGGDRVENILWRIENGELDGVNPKVIVLMAGTNNIGSTPIRGAAAEARAAEITQGLQAVIDICRQKAPNATILLFGIFPRNDNPTANAVITRVNDHLATLADGKTLRFLNINDNLAEKDGTLREGVATPDRLHLQLKGYQIWGEALKPVLTELLGPPAKEDHAPPPTGDPSAAGRVLQPPPATAPAGR
jgi:lysophospholipase L1-like esterase